MGPEPVGPRQAGPPGRLHRVGLFFLAVGVASVAGALVEWTTRWVLPSVAAVFLGRVAAMFPVFYWMPVILAEQPMWTSRRRVRFALAAGTVLAALALVIGML